LVEKFYGPDLRRRLDEHRECGSPSKNQESGGLQMKITTKSMREEMAKLIDETSGLNPKVATEFLKFAAGVDRIKEMTTAVDEAAPLGSTLKLADIGDPALRHFAKVFRSSTLGNTLALSERLWPHADDAPAL
jgi:hypothetical protein